MNDAEKKGVMLSCPSFYMENFVLSACKDMKIFVTFRGHNLRINFLLPFYLKLNDMSKTRGPPAESFSWRILKMANFLQTFANIFYLCALKVKPFTI